MLTNVLYYAVILLLLPISTSSFFVLPPTSLHTTPASFITRISSTPPSPLTEPADLSSTRELTHANIKTLLSLHPIVLFIKGTSSFPQCGFSDTALKILNFYNLNFHTVDVLADPNIREHVKTYSDWPTIPQLYVKGEFVGGCDIMIEGYKEGELEGVIKGLLSKE